MKKKILSLAIIATTTSLLAQTPASSDELYAGINVNAGSGSVKLHSSNGTNYTFTDSDSVSANAFKAYAGYQSLYAFYEHGGISPDTRYLNDLTYDAIGLGFLRRATFWKKTIAGVEIVPEGDFEIGYDKVTGSGFDASGLLLAFDAGIATHIESWKNISLTAGVGYDIHVVNDNTSTNLDGSWNFTSLNVNVGVRYDF